MGRAFDEATDVLHVTPRTPRIVPNVIAKHIIAVAKDGERDPHELCKLALEKFRDRHILRGTALATFMREGY